VTVIHVVIEGPIWDAAKLAEITRRMKDGK